MTVPFDARFYGRPITLQYARNLLDTAGNQAHAATFIRERRMVLDQDLRRNPQEHKRILTHELFHFVWVRLGNPKRLTWEALLQTELTARVRGETGWSAELRKLALTSADPRHRTRKWREYCCEAFCDTAAALETNVRTEVTLAGKYLATRRRWFAEQLADQFPI